MPNYILLDFECPKCGVTEKLVERGTKTVVCCGKTATATFVYSAPRVVNCWSFTPHFDMTQGKYFGSAEEKQRWLKGKDKEQVSGLHSPRKTTGTSVICSREQAKRFIGRNAKSIKSEELQPRRTRVSVSPPTRNKE